MSSDFIMLLFDIIILVYGVYGIFSAVRMKNTGIPSAILVSRDEINKVKNAKEFCNKMYQPTLVFGAMACIYSLLEVLNQYVIKQALVDIFGVVCFLIVCAWYVKELRKVKEKHVS